MYGIERYYDHYVITRNGDVLFHVDSLLEAEKELEKLNGEEKTKIEQNVVKSKRYNNYHKHTYYSLCQPDRLHLGQSRSQNREAWQRPG